MQAGGTALNDALVVPDEIRWRTRRRTRRWSLFGVVLAAAVVLLAWRAPWRRAPPAFRMGRVERRTIETTVEATGRLDVLARTEVPAPAGGTLVTTRVRQGDHVERGDPLAELDERAARIAVDLTSAELQAATGHAGEARAALDGSAESLDRALRLYERGLASERDVVAARASAEQARAAAVAADAERRVATQKVARERLAKSLHVLSAPMSGIVLSAPDGLGMVVAPERGPLFVIGSALDALRLDASVAEADIAHIEPSQHATFVVPAFPGRRFSADVESMDVQATSSGTSVRYLVHLVAHNPELALLPGMTATVDFETGRAENVLAVREAALRFQPKDAVPAVERSRVFRLGQKGDLESIPVTPGLSDGEFTAVSPGPGATLSPGDPVVVGGVSRPEADRLPGGPGISLGNR
jgi:HlyD family secretion protein